MARLRVGIVGAGTAGLGHLRRLLAREDAQVVGMADPSPARRRQVTGMADLATYESPEELLDVHQLDAAFVCLPPHQHGRTERLLVDAAVPMLIEKPVALDLATAEAIGSLLEDTALPAVVGYQWRQLSFLPAVRVELADRQLDLVTATWMCPAAEAPWWGDVRLAGGQFTEQGTHLVDLAINLVGRIEVVAGVAAERRVGGNPQGFARASTVIARVGFAAAGSFTATCALAEPYRRSLELVADRLLILITEEGGRCVNTAGTSVWHHEAPDLYVREHDAFFDLVTHGSTSRPLATYAEALETLRVTSAMESALANDERPSSAAGHHRS